MAFIDQYSLSAKPLEMRFNGQPLSTGTGFIWRDGGQAFLVTNWHNVTGINPRTRKHLSPTGAEPNLIRFYADITGALGSRGSVDVNLRAPSGEPLWLEHPTRTAIDVVALRLPDIADKDLHSINEMPSTSMRVTIGADSFILGYPFGIGISAFPIWKRASIASEPDFFVDNEPRFFVDTASRPGMSGAPVIARQWGGYLDENGNQIISGGAFTRFIGIYSGRIGADDELQAQLGVVWQAALVTEIISGGKRGAVP